MLKRALRPGRDILGKKGVFLHITDEGRPYPTPTDPPCLLRCVTHYQLWLYFCGDDMWECRGCHLKLRISPEPAHDPSVPIEVRRRLRKTRRKWWIISRLRAVRRWWSSLIK